MVRNNQRVGKGEGCKERKLDRKKESMSEKKKKLERKKKKTESVPKRHHIVSSTLATLYTVF